MPQTPDARYGELIEDEGIVLGPTALADAPGKIRYTGTRFSFQDAGGEFDPRTSVSLHAPTHSKGGVDEVLAQNLGSGAAPADKILQADGAGGWNLVDYVEAFPPELQSGEYLVPFATSSGVYQQVWRYTTTDLPAGDYFIAAQATLDTTNAGNVTDARIQLDDVVDIGKTIGPVAYVGGSRPMVAVRSVTLTAGVHTIDFDLRKAKGHGSVEINACYVTLWRVA